MGSLALSTAVKSRRRNWFCSSIQFFPKSVASIARTVAMRGKARQVRPSIDGLARCSGGTNPDEANGWKAVAAFVWMTGQYDDQLAFLHRPLIEGGTNGCFEPVRAARQGG